MEIEFCLDPFTVVDCTPEEGIEIAAASGCRFAGLWVQAPPDFAARCVVEAGAMAERVRRSLAANDVRLLNLEVFDLRADTDVPSFRGALERGAGFGARAANTLFRGEADAQQRLDKFVAFCELAAELGLRTNVEFISYTTLSSLEQALDLIEQADQPQVGVVVDILHLMRSGGTVEQLRRMDPGLIGHAQVCDGPATISPDARRAESGFNRLVPGDGAFPIRAFCGALPRLPLGLEVPPGCEALRGLTPRERVRRVVEATRRILVDGPDEAAP